MICSWDPQYLIAAASTGVDPFPWALCRLERESGLSQLEPELAAHHRRPQREICRNAAFKALLSAELRHDPRAEIPQRNRTSNCFAPQYSNCRDTAGSSVPTIS